VLFAVLGCGDNNAVPNAWTSSDRYRADLYRAEDVAILRGWYDNYLQLDCTTEQLAGPLNCPRAGHVFYADSGCSQPWVDDDDLKNPASYYQGTGGYYKITDFQRLPHEEFFVDGTGVCRDNHLSAHGYTAMKVDASSFVTRQSVHHVLYGVGFDALESDDGSQEIISVDGGVLVNAASTGRLQVREYLNGGIRVPVQPDPLFDRNLNENCHPARDLNGVFRCAVDSVEPGTHRVTNDSACASNLIPASFEPGFVTDEMTSLVDGLPQLGLLNYRCPNAADGPWYELVNNTFCVPISSSQTVYPCSSFPSDIFASLSVDRE
jgi:hypothetical protein